MPDPERPSPREANAIMSKAESKAETLKPRLPRGFVDRRADETVSYTHLTLPTILLV